jgi:hypothetical protein
MKPDLQRILDEGVRSLVETMRSGDRTTVKGTADWIRSRVNPDLLTEQHEGLIEVMLTHHARLQPLIVKPMRWFEKK